MKPKPNPLRLRSCIWDVDDTTWVTAVSVPATAWARGLPQAYDSSVTLGLTDTQRRQLTKSGSGCQVFTRAVAAEHAHGPVLVTESPNLVVVRAVTASTCTRGVFTSVTSVRDRKARRVSPAVLRHDLTRAHRMALAGR